MIITRTPFRISFFGGGTDYPGWYTQHGGEVLSTTIDKYCYINCRHLLAPSHADGANLSSVLSKDLETTTHGHVTKPAIRADFVPNVNSGSRTMAGRRTMSHKGLALNPTIPLRSTA
jgi:galactokinase/mevalonate kinase-like predicted kinase